MSNTLKQDRLQTPAPSICNDDSRAPLHKNEVGATVEPTNNKSKASKDINRAEFGIFSGILLECV